MVKFYSELNAQMLGLVFGIIWAAVVLLISLVSLLTQTYGLDFIYLMKSVYPYYGLNVLGIILGTAYGFIDGFICGFVTAWLYNRFIK